jgi:hypothetical protein
MPTIAKDVKMVIALLQLPMTAIVVAISVKDSTAMKVGVFLQGEKKDLLLEVKRSNLKNQCLVRTW